ncbi:unnamed protein product [Amoebophrya sp. A25]|nr:unnamed protein product [Amoebophrya sp. A25]|eukprot:GSA25T00004324001.1
MESSGTTKLSFCSYGAVVDPTFWQELARKKLDEWKLDGDLATPITADILFAPSKANFSYKSFTPRTTNSADPSDGKAKGTTSTSSSSSSTPPPSGIGAAGTLRNMSTIEEFKRYDRQDLLDAAQKKLWGALKAGELVQPCVLVSFADLKKYHFFYTLGFPYIKPTCGVDVAATEDVTDPTLLSQIGKVTASASSGGSPLPDGIRPLGARSYCCQTTWDVLFGGAKEVAVYLDSGDQTGVYDVGFRNFLTMLWLDDGGGSGSGSYLSPRKEDGADKVEVQCCVVQKGKTPQLVTIRYASSSESVRGAAQPPPKAFAAGWLKNEQNSVVRMVDLAQWLDPGAIAKSAVDLNIKLMKWRLVPDLEPEKIQNLRFLMLGSGTLGCAIARNLLGWGVRHITFLDSSIVNMSNPVRQSLFTHRDAVERRGKAECAAQRAKDVMPELEAAHHHLEIPMPGHPASFSEESIAKLESLVDSHDVVCMLTDSRESRWLPSLLVADRQKTRPILGLTVALGFDSFVVMTQTCGNAQRACYFCNDVSAPTDSLKERTLDRQCTVVRPGVSGIASALAVELVAAMSQHADGFQARANESLLGQVPNQIRGYLSDYRLVPIETEPFKHCVCCSDPIIEAYRKDGLGFVKKCVADNRILEEISGLNGMKSTVEAQALEAIDLELDEEDEDLCVL